VRGWKKTDRKERRRRRNGEERVLRDNYACLYRVTWYHRNVLIINSIKNLKYNRENIRQSTFQIPMRISVDTRQKFYS